MQYIRTGGRIPIEAPVEIRWKAPGGKLKEAQGETVSISSNGVHMTVAAKIRPRTPVTITVRLPLEITRVPLVLQCQGRVVKQAPGATGLRAVIDEYELHPAVRSSKKAARTKK
jgi:hypothetical protein